MMDEVRRQYERWIYPQPVEDLSSWIAEGGRAIGDARAYGDVYWPATGYRDGMDILVAGCGANQAARYALEHPSARVTGIDISAASLAHEEKLKARHGLDNLSLRQMRLEEVAELEREFDFIACSGVLHHLPDPLSGLRALAGALHRDGVIYVMLYGRYGRAAVYMMQELFRIIGATGQSDEDLDLVKATMPLLHPEHPLRAYAKRSADMKHDAGLVDLFLHTQDRPFAVGEVLQLVRDAGLAFQTWLEPMYYNPDAAIPDSHPLYARLDALGDEERWRAMELIAGIVPRHDFCVCRRDRPTAGYRIAPDEPGFADRAVPLPPASVLTPAAGGKPATLGGAGAPTITLPPPLVAIFEAIDGARSVRECLAAAALSIPADKLAHHGLRFFRTLWRTGHVRFRLTGAP